MIGPAEAGPPPEAASLVAGDGVRLHLRVWSVHRPRATLVAVHGVGEHAGRLASLAAELTRRGIAVFAADLRGHGRSGGQRGHVRRFERFVDDVHGVGREAAARHPGLPTLLFGHSLGGLIAARVLETQGTEQPRAAVLSAPALGLGSGVPVWRSRLARLAERVLPALPAPTGIDPDWLSRDPDQVAAYRADPLVHGRMTPRLFTEMEDAMRRARRERGRIRVPLLVLVPGADRVVSPAATLAFCEGTGFEVRRYPEMRHEPLHELGREQVARDVGAWLEAQLP